MITFNSKVRLILADVDETIADVYTKATPEMIDELNKLLSEKRVLFLVSGGGLQSIQERITDFIKPELRHRILVAHCSGAEVWGFAQNGNLNAAPYYGVYEGHFTEEQKREWRVIVNKLLEKFHLKTYPTQQKAQFVQLTGGDPLSIMLADRGPQITLEFVNASNLSKEQAEKIEKEVGITIPFFHDTYDLRIPVLAEAQKLYQSAGFPVNPILAGTCALDNVIEGVDKTRAVKFVLQHESILKHLDIHKDDIDESSEIEIWGDKFTQKKGGPDFHMCLAVSPTVRAIDFRQEDKADLPNGYNIQIWDGVKHLHNGLLEYLQNRHG